MNEYEFAEDVVSKIRALEERYSERAFLFVLAALEYAQNRLPARRHISGEELAWACRDFALAQFGLMARTVLEYWHVESTRDFGKVVFTLVDVGLLAKESPDRLEDFDRVYEFAEVFDHGYRWVGTSVSSQASAARREGVSDGGE